MKNRTEQPRYVAYCRKSSEDRDKQVLSLPAQMAWAKEVVDRVGGTIQEIVNEERSAKTPCNRPGFDEMVARVRRGELNAIICWKLDRLARNPEEAGIILGLLKRGEIRRIITSDREYRPEDNAIISYVDFGMADQYVRDLSKNVKRGLKAKIAAGWRPGGAPLGYLNNLDRVKGERDIIPDPERFDLVHRIFRTFLSGEYSVRQLQAQTVFWGLKTRQTRRQGGKYLQISHIYRALTEPFYYGWFPATDPETGERKLVKGSHRPMITEQEFDLIQIKLGRKGKPRTRKHNLIYTGKIQCGECESMVTGEEKHQMICSRCKLKFLYLNKDACPGCETKIEEMKKPTVLHYIYYRCTKKKRPTCTQKSVRIDALEPMIDSALKKFNLSKEFTDWALEELAQDTDREVNSQKAVVDSQQQRYRDVVGQLLNLTQLYTSPRNIEGSLMGLDEYEASRVRLLSEKRQLEEAQKDTGRKIEEWVDWVVNSFDFATAARIWFENGSPEEKKSIFLSLSGSNLILKERMLAISLKKPLDLYALIAARYPSTTITLEPKDKRATAGEHLPFSADIPGLRAMWVKYPPLQGSISVSEGSDQRSV